MQTILSSRLMSTRGGTIAIGATAAALGALLLIVYLNGYRNSVRSSGAPVTVLVAKDLIPKGTPATVVAAQGLLEATTVTRDQLKDGALVDPAAIRSRVAVNDIYPGQQITSADFTVETTDAIPTRITGASRALALPMESARGLIGVLREGDRVDVYVAVAGQGGGLDQPIVRLLLPNVLVLAAPDAAQGGINAGGASNVVLEVKAAQAGRLAFAAEHGKLWFALRPQSGATPTKPDLVTIQRLLVGSAPVDVTTGG